MTTEKTLPFTISEEDIKVLTEISGLVFEPNTSAWKTAFKNIGDTELKGLKYAIGITILFALVNYALVIAGIVKIFFFGGSEWKGFLLMLVIGTVSTVFAGYKSYNYLTVDIARILYEKFFHKIYQFASRMLVDEMTKQMQANNASFHFGDIFVYIGELCNGFKKFLPRFVIRLLEIKAGEEESDAFHKLAALKSNLDNGENEKAADAIFTYIDWSVKLQLEELLTLSWLRWLIPLTLILMLSLLAII